MFQKIGVDAFSVPWAFSYRFPIDPLSLPVKGTPLRQSRLRYSGFLSTDLQSGAGSPSSSRILGEQGEPLVYFQEWNIEGLSLIHI